MNDVITIGVDLTKNDIRVHGVDAEGAVVVRRQLRRSQVPPLFKNDVADAEAMCGAMTRPTMRFVEIKTLDQQAVLTVPRTRPCGTKEGERRNNSHVIACDRPAPTNNTTF
jgi:transposase